MPSNMNALLIAWAISLIIVIGGTVYLQLSYDNIAHTEDKTTVNNTLETSSNSKTNNPLDDNRDDGETTSNTPHDIIDPVIGDQPLTTANNNVDAQSPSLAPEEPATPSSINSIDVGLLEETRAGKLPMIAADGRQSSLFYASPVKADEQLPRIAIIITDIGRRSRQTQRAFDTLPPNVTIAFSPYGTNLDKWSNLARKKGHESLLMIPMEPTNSAQNDAGPLALLAANNSRQNLNLLRSSLARTQGYVGVINHMGSRFTALSDALNPILKELENRGLLFVDSRATQFSRAASMSRALNIPTALSNSYIDDQPNQSSISTELSKLEGRARTLGAAVGIIHAYPISINAITEWASGLEARGYQLVPISQVVDRQPLSR
jgi:polysaccharide deacetylase 2 family uncharacterized protein YibQ